VPYQQHQAPPPSYQHESPPPSYKPLVQQYTANQDNIQKLYVPPFKRQNNLPIQENQEFKDYKENKVPLGLFFGPDSIWNPK
jgi:hypothetical protein